MSNAKQVDLIISPSWIVPIVPNGTCHSDCSVVIDRGLIVGIYPTDSIDKHYTAQAHYRLPEQVVMPGLINAHGHGAMSLLRGYADDVALMTWLNEHIWPTENQWVSETFVRDGMRLAMVEMLQSGTTCFSDMYYYPEATASAAFEVGMRAQVNFPVLDFPTVWAQSADDYIHKGLALHDNYRSHELIHIGFGPHAPYTVSDEPLQTIATYAEELQMAIHIHLHETTSEVSDAVAKYGRRPIERLADLGILSPLTQCVHMTQANEDDLSLLSQSGAHVVHCPSSNLKLASGLCPVSQMHEQAINVCLGTDGAASNNTLNLFSEIRTAALLGKLAAGDAAAIPASDALALATINGAKAMGLDEKIGSIEAGKQADIIAIDLSRAAQAPLHDVISQLVYTEVGHRVTHCWVDGKILMRDKSLTTLSSTDVLHQARHWQTTLTR